MTAEKYEKQIVKRINCSRKKQSDIRRQLLADIEERRENGEILSDIIMQMGSVQEIAAGFNETIPEQEKHRCRLRKTCRVIAIAVLVFLVAAVLLYWYLPKIREVGGSKTFDQKQIEETLQETITLFEQRDYAGLQNMATDEMQEVLSAEIMDDARNAVSRDWGKRIAMGNVYMNEVTQMNEQYVICQVSVSYENIGVVYTITYDAEGRIAGLYMK